MNTLHSTIETCVFARLKRQEAVTPKDILEDVHRCGGPCMSVSFGMVVSSLRKMEADALLRFVREKGYVSITNEQAEEGAHADDTSNN